MNKFGRQSQYTTPRLRHSTLLSLYALERYFLHIIASFAVVTVVLIATKTFVMNVGQVNGVSMEPTFVDQNRFLVNKIAYYVRSPKRQDVVQIVELKEQQFLIKRVIGLPGETVIIKQGKVFIRSTNEPREKILDEPYLPSTSYTTVPLQRGPQIYDLGPEEYFVLGDHREQSTDSRVYGPVHRSRLLGAVIAKL